MCSHGNKDQILAPTNGIFDTLAINLLTGTNTVCKSERRTNQKVTVSDLPDQSWLHAKVRPGDFLDCYSVQSSLPPRQAADIVTDFPGWAHFLLLIRRLVTTPFGLSNDGPSAKDKIGIFPVEKETDEELIAGFNDKHLDFSVSVMSVDNTVYLATWVHTHNLGGRIYLKTIMPFHILISRNALGRVALKSAVTE